MAMREGFVQHQAKRILAQDRYALVVVIGLMLLPYTAWVSMAVLSLVTLRKGAKAGFLLLMPALTAHMLVLLPSVSWVTALIDALVRVLPCYLAALVLRETSSWKAVAGLFFCILMLGALLLQSLAPSWITAQYAYLQEAIRTFDANQVVLTAWKEQGVRSFVMANYLLGFQAVCLFVANGLSLLCARHIQSRLYYPDGFRQEMLNFRGDKQTVLMLVLLSLAAYYDRALAMNGLPFMLFFFGLAGLSLCVCALAQAKPLWRVILLILPVVVIPWLALPFYVLLGACDSLFNFRLYLLRAGKIT